MSLAAENEVLKLRNNDLETEQRSELHRAKTQVNICWDEYFDDNLRRFSYEASVKFCFLVKFSSICQALRKN